MGGQSYSHEAYYTLMKDTFDKCAELGQKKGGEYAGDGDRLANFRRNGVSLNLPMEVIWGAYAAKHWDALMQYISDLNTGAKRPRMEPIEGRVDDLIVYLVLMKCMIDERNGF